MIDFEYKRIADQISGLISELDTLVEGLNNQHVGDSARSIRGELRGLSEKTRLEIAFVGQYSSGKSTIIRALTGDDRIVIGQDITTDKATPYPWGGHVVVDTPGIYAGRPEHDEISLKFMDSADLVVYVVTVNGFDPLIGANFRKLAFEDQRVNKMMLVVNKRSTEAEVNLQHGIEDIEKVIEPASSKEVFLSVIDAREYIDSLAELDKNMQKELRGLSQFEEFIQRLNEFVKEKGLAGRLISPLNTIVTGINHLINLLTAGDDDIRKVQEAIRQKRFIVADSLDKVMLATKSEVNTLRAGIKLLGSKLAAKIVDDAEQESLEEENDKTVAEIETMCDSTDEAIARAVRAELAVLDEKCGDLARSPLMNDILQFGRTRADVLIDLHDNRMDERIKKLPEAIGKIGNLLHTRSIGPNVKAGGLLGVSGSNVHEAVLKMGKVVNFKFKPYQATKIASKIGKAGKLLGVAQIVLGPAIAWFEEKQEKKYRKEIKEVRISVRHNYQKYADAIADEYKSEILKKLESFFVGILDEIDKDAMSLRSKTMIEQKTVQQLLSIQAKAKGLLQLVC